MKIEVRKNYETWDIASNLADYIFPYLCQYLPNRTQIAFRWSETLTEFAFADSNGRIPPGDRWNYDCPVRINLGMTKDRMTSELQRALCKLPILSKEYQIIESEQGR